MILKRLFGLLLIVRGIAPIAIIIILGVVGNIILKDIQTTIATPLEELETSLQQVEITVNQATNTFETVRQQATETSDWLENNLSIPQLERLETYPFTNPNVILNPLILLINIFIIDPFNDFSVSVNRAFNEVETAINTLEDLADPLTIIPTELTNIATQLQDLYTTLFGLSEQWATIGTVATLAVGALLAVMIVVSFFDDVGRGWRLLTEKSQTG